MLTKKQMHVLELLATQPDASMQEIASEAGVTNVYVSKLKARQDFKEALEKRLHELFEEGTKYAVKTIVNAAKEGNINAATYILNSCGYQAEQKININSNTIHVSIKEDTTE